MLVFRRAAFVAGPSDPRTFHQRAIEDGRFYEKRVAANLSELVFDQVFPGLARAIAAAAPKAPLPDVREAALILLYRLLFILYAEDRDLLPVRDTRYDDYALRKNVRGDIGQRKDQEDAFSARATRYWSAIDDLCQAIAHGDASIGLPAYNGGLFDQARTPLLGQIRLDEWSWPPSSMRCRSSRPRTAATTSTIATSACSSSVRSTSSCSNTTSSASVTRSRFASTVSRGKGLGATTRPMTWSALIIKETIEPLVRSRIDAFMARHAELATSPLSEGHRMDRLKAARSGEKLLDLKVCDPAMGSGHFLVNLVDYLADRVITAMAEAEAAVDGYVSPLIARIDNIRTTIMAKAEACGWTIDEDQLDDRHIVRRMVLKRCVYGVDKNPMAVGTRQGGALAAHLHGGCPVKFPGSPPALRRQFVRILGAHRN